MQMSCMHAVSEACEVRARACVRACVCVAKGVRAWLVCGLKTTFSELTCRPTNALPLNSQITCQSNVI